MDLKELKISDRQDQRHPWEEVRAEVILNILKKEFGKSINKELTVFDIGCGDTYLIEQLSHYFPSWKFLAIDNAFTENDLNFFKFKYKNSPISVFSSTVEAWQAGKPADLILLLDVIEHIENDTAFLKDLKSQPFVHNETKFLITVPAFQSLFSSHDVFLGHYRRYTNQLLRSTILTSGLQPLKTGYFFTSLLLPRFIQTKLEKVFSERPATGVAGWKGNKVMGIIIKNILRVDYIINLGLSAIKIKLPGLSNFAICKKPV